MARNDVNIVVKARDEASRKFNRIGKSAGGMGSMFRKAAAAAAVYFGARAIKRFTTESLRLYGIQETAVNNLTAALDNLGDAGQINEMKGFASDLQKITTAGDESTLGIMALGASMGNLSGDELKDATKAAMGLAKAYNMDTVAAMRLVARARMGDTASLSRYGIKLDATLSAQEKFNKVIEIGAKNFKLVTAETNTFAGKVQQMKNAIGDVKEEIGSALMPMFLSSAVRIKTWAEDNQKRIGQWAKKTVAAVTLVKDVFFSFAGYMKDDWQGAVGFVFDSFLTLLKATFESAVTLAIAGGKGIWKGIKEGLSGGHSRELYDSAEQVFEKKYGRAPEKKSWYQHQSTGTDTLGSYVRHYDNEDDNRQMQDLVGIQHQQQSLEESGVGSAMKNALDTFKTAGKEIAANMPAKLAVDVDADFAKFQTRLDAIINPPKPAGGDNSPNDEPPAAKKAAADSLEMLKKIATNTTPKLGAQESRFLTYDSSAKSELDPLAQLRQSRKELLDLESRVEASGKDINNFLRNQRTAAGGGKVEQLLGQMVELLKRQTNKIAASTGSPPVIRSL